MPTRICIVGCGAIGSLYAVHLAQLPDAEVWAFDTSEDHVAAINRDGVRLTGHLELTGRVRATTDASSIPPCELGIVAVKGTVTEAAIAATAAVFEDGAVCSVQNGIGNEEVIAGHLSRVMRGVTLPAGRIVEPGVVQMYAPGPTWIGPFEPSPADMAEVERLGSLLNESGMETRVRDDARGAQWSKLLFNAATNPVCALTGLTHGEMWDCEPTRRLSRSLLEEGRAVAQALEIALDGDPAAMVAEGARINFHHRPSMLQDVAAGRATEIETINGGIVRAAAEARVDAPLNGAIADLIRGVERSQKLADGGYPTLGDPAEARSTMRA